MLRKRKQSKKKQSVKLSFKLIFTFIFYFSDSLARPIVVITHNNLSWEKKVRTIILKELNIPSILITSIYKEKLKCIPVQRAIIQICHDKKNNLLFPVYKQRVLEKSFKTFLEDPSFKKNEIKKRSLKTTLKTNELKT